MNETAPQQPAEVRLTDETIAYLEKKMAGAVRDGIKQAVTELQGEAHKRAGKFVLGGLWGLMSRFFLFLLLGSIVYAIGGWNAIGALWKTMFTAT